MARAKKKFSRGRKKRGGKKYGRRRKSTRGFKRVECQLGRAALMYSKAKGFLSRVEKTAARGKAENPGKGPSAVQKSRLMRGKTVLKTEYEKYFAPKLRKFGWVPGKNPDQKFPALFGSKGYFLVLLPSTASGGSVSLYQDDKYIEPNPGTGSLAIRKTNNFTAFKEGNSVRITANSTGVYPRSKKISWSEYHRTFSGMSDSNFDTAAIWGAGVGIYQRKAR